MEEIYSEQYIVQSVEAAHGDVKLNLRKYVPPPPPEPEPEPEPVPPDPLLTIKPETDEEIVAVRMLKAFRKFGLFPEPVPMSVPRMTRVYATKPIEPVTITLTMEEYNNLGKPGLGAPVSLTLQLEEIYEDM